MHEESLENAVRFLEQAREQVALLVGTIVVGADDDCSDFEEREVARARRAGAQVAQNVDAAIGEIEAILKTKRIVAVAPIDAAAEE